MEPLDDGDGDSGIIDDDDDDPAYECPHEWSEETDTWWYEYVKDEAVQNDDGTHTVPGYRVTVRYCTSCGEDFEVTAAEPETVTEECYYYLDVCTVCGRKNPCDHSTGWQELYKSSREIDQDSLEDNEDGTHTVKYRNYNDYICHNCSSEYRVYDATWTGPVNEKHIWHKDGYCSVCWIQNSCQHPNLATAEAKKPVYYYQDTEDEHTVSGDVYTVYSCANCGMAYEEYQNKYLENEAHDFTNGDCVCGASGACVHADSYKTDDWWYEFVTEGAVPNDDGSHTVPGYLITLWHCNDCGEDFQVKAEEPDSVTDMCYYYHDVCTTCGRTNPCDHSTDEQELLEKEREIDEDSLARNEDGTHTVKYRYCYEYLCHNCNSEYAVYDETWTGPVNENHIWHKDGFCNVCGADNSCQHPNLETSDVKRPGRYYMYDDDVHTVTGGVYILYSCTDCGMAYEDYQNEYNEDEEHDFSNGNCICGECGHVNAEATGDTWDTWEDVENNMDGATHTGAVVTYAEYHCPDCNRYFVRATGRQEDQTGSHEFDENNRCAICGAENICPHEGEWYIDIYHDVDYDEIVYTDAKLHGYPSQLKIRTYCVLCNGCIDEETIEENPCKYPHSFIDGICTSCGYTNECPHENTHDVYRFYTDYDLAFSEPVDGLSMHTAGGYIVTFRECLDCGESIFVEMIETEGTEPHSFNEDGYCYICGAENTCQHKNVAQQEWADCGAADDIDDDGHKVNAWHGIYRYCEDCGAWMGEELTSDVEEMVLPHEYRNGVCIECGHANPCTHENTVTDTVRESITLSHDTTQHTIYAQDQLQTWCTDCGELLSAVSAGDAEFITEKHSLTRDGSFLVCDTCGYSKKAPACKTHKYVKVKAVAATCLEDGHKEYYECSVCGTPKTQPVVIPAKGHTPKLVPAVEKTCTEPGWSEYTACSVCGMPLTTPVMYTPVGHVPVDDSAVDGTCVTMGLTAGVHCDVCGEAIVPQQELGYGDHLYENDECVYCGRFADIRSIDIPYDYIELGAKDTHQLHVSVTPEKSAGRVVYSSSNPKVAKVDSNSRITALKAGTATIYALGDAVFTTVNVEVRAGVSKMNMSNKTLLMEIGETNNKVISVKLTGFTANDLTWTSSNPSVVEIMNVSGENAALCGKKAGTATIKVKSSSGKYATCKVTVVSPTKLVSAVLYTGGTSFMIGDETRFYARTIPMFETDSGVTVTFKSSNAKVMKIDPTTGDAVAMGAGKATITVTAVQGKIKKTASAKVTVADPGKLQSIGVDNLSTKQTYEVGETYSVSVRANPSGVNATFSAKSSRPSVVGVRMEGDKLYLTTYEGVTGTAKVTITAVDSNGIKKTFVSNITVKDPYAPLSVYLNASGTYTLADNEPYVKALVRNMNGYNSSDLYTVTYKSSNPKIAAVNSEGQLTLLKAGKVTITATATYGKIKKSAKRTIVILDPNKLNSVVLYQTYIEGHVGGRALINGYLTPSETIDYSTVNLTMKSSNTKLATVDRYGFVDLKAPGTVTITVTATQGKIKKTAKVKIKILK